MTLLALSWPDFLSPGRLWVLFVPLLLLGLYLVLLRRKSKQGMRYTNTSILQAVVPAQSQWLRHVTVGLVLLSLVFLAFAWARPLGRDEVPRERATVVIILDCSYSMEATDVSPSRFDVAKTEAGHFLDALPDGFNVAVVEMSGNSSLILPPTEDRNAARRAINGAETAPSTDVAGALDAARQAIEMAPQGEDGERVPAMVILLSDASGTTAPTSPKQAAGQLANLGVPIYPIVFGTDYGYVDIANDEGQTQRYPVAPDHAFFEDLASITDGQSYNADNASQAQKAYDAIESDVGYVEVDREITAWTAGIAAIFAAVAAVGAVMLGTRWR
ncbi:MAG: VWA domain-containing protein [Propionibacteriaceae bacterium]|jgi:Ca-activated chloride channel family protein|nr:VWA domain-containing protein [Propionibacteriaceae bacterium]